MINGKRRVYFAIENVFTVFRKRYTVSENRKVMNGKVMNGN